MRIVLGERDTEARAIDEVARRIVVSPLEIVWTSGDPYRLDPGFLRPGDMCVECGAPGWDDGIRVDHHFPGDLGYDVTAEFAFGGSSLGQALHWLMNEARCQMPAWPVVAPVPSPGVYKIDGEWCAAPRDCIARAIPLRYVMVGEADHTLAAFLAGGCTTRREDAIAHYVGGRRLPDIGGIVSRIRAGDQVLPGVYDIRWLPWFRRTDILDVYTAALIGGVGIVSWGAAEIVGGGRHIRASCTGDGSAPGPVDIVGLLLDMGCTGVYGSNIRGYAGGVR